ncbi:hypothetical protein GDO86_003556 [Hymenochirus boettgeri]|uniref:Solute carrier family 41 member n=1 Tax=Hymenochirus boettgeri TaxID=247094 RepID=A0A8T2K6W9_9PIPI|nr:hypothetical protein GDO86_003556 [Hymenochirus boettgeri]
MPPVGENADEFVANGVVNNSFDSQQELDVNRNTISMTTGFLGTEESAVVMVGSRANTKGVQEEDSLLENVSQSTESDDPNANICPEGGVLLKETSFSIGLQVLFPFLLAGFGTVVAGMVLDIVQHWDVFTEVTEVFILVPALLGLKGNLG